MKKIMPDFKKVSDKIYQIVTDKNKKYGDSFNTVGDILRILYPEGVQPEQFDDLLTVTRILDKLSRIATNNLGDEEDPWTDICGYGLLSMERNSRNEKSL